jgi:hypothetical protein
LPRGRRRHITDLRHIASFGSHSGYEAPVNSYLTGASPFFQGCARARGAVLDCSLHSLRCSLVAAVFVGSGETNRARRIARITSGVSPTPPADRRRHEHREPTRSSLARNKAHFSSLTAGRDMFRASLLHSSAAPPPTLAQRKGSVRARALSCIASATGFHAARAGLLDSSGAYLIRAMWQCGAVGGS